MVGESKKNPAAEHVEMKGGEYSSKGRMPSEMKDHMVCSKTFSSTNIETQNGTSNFFQVNPFFCQPDQGNGLQEADHGSSCRWESLGETLVMFLQGKKTSDSKSPKKCLK